MPEFCWHDHSRFREIIKLKLRLKPNHYYIYYIVISPTKINKAVPQIVKETIGVVSIFNYTQDLNLFLLIYNQKILSKNPLPCIIKPLS